ncbi:hypothetical protein FOBRF1_002604 [Fusarium oxysporum]
MIYPGRNGRRAIQSYNSSRIPEAGDHSLPIQDRADLEKCLKVWSVPKATLQFRYAIGLNPQSWEHMVLTCLTPTMPYPGTLHHIRTTTRAINSTFNVLMGHCCDKTLGQLIAVHWAAFPQWSRGSVEPALSRIVI